MNNTQLIADFIYKINYDSLPEKVIQKAKLCFLDWLGVTIVGSREPLSNILYEYIRESGGNKQATLIGRDFRTSQVLASLYNGSAGHALDYDDIYLSQPGHPSSPVIPAALAIAEWNNMTGKEFITAITVGIQIEYLIGTAIMPQHYKIGWHNTSTLGHIGAAAASSKLLKLDVKRITYALGLAGTQASGVQAVFGSMAKALHAGVASMNGIAAALLAEKGFTSANDIFDHKFGFLNVMADVNYPEKIIENIKKYAILEVGFKRYASCYATHTAIECVRAIQNKVVNINPDNIINILCCVYPRVKDLAVNSCPKTGLEGKFSVEFCIAAAIIDGQVTIDTYTDKKVNDIRIRELMKKIEIKVNKSAHYTDERLTEVIISLNNGDVLAEEINLVKLMKDVEKEKIDVLFKFNQLMAYIGEKKRGDHFINLVGSLENVKNMKDIFTNIPIVKTNAE